MEKRYVILVIGLVLFGNTLSHKEKEEEDSEEEDDNSGYDEEDYDDDDYDEGSTGDDDDNRSTECQRLEKDYAEKKSDFRPNCLGDGQYAPRQCRGDSCWCVNGLGKEIRGTRDSHNCDSFVDTDLTFEENHVRPLEQENFVLRHPGILAGIVGGVFVCLLCAVLVVMFIVYRMKKKDEGSYILGRAERKNSRTVVYTKAVPKEQEFYA